MARFMPIALLLLAWLAVPALAQTLPAPPPRTITVTGTAEQRVPPDLALIVLAVETQADTVAHAAARNNQSTQSVITAVQGLQLPNLDVRTLTYTVQPMYEQPVPGRPVPATPRIVGYQITNQVEVRLPDADTARLSANVGSVLDAATRAGANRVDDLTFTLQDANPALRAVLAQATRDALSTAQTLATAAGVGLGPLLSLSTTEYPRPQPMFARAASMNAAALAVPISAGPLTLSATVSAVYGIQ